MTICIVKGTVEYVVTIIHLQPAGSRISSIFVILFTALHAFQKSELNTINPPRVFVMSLTSTPMLHEATHGHAHKERGVWTIIGRAFVLEG